MRPVVISIAGGIIPGLLFPLHGIASLVLFVMVIVFQEESGKMAIGIGLVPCEDQVIVVGILRSCDPLILQVEMLLHVLPDHLLLAIGAGIIQDEADKGEAGLLQAESVHRVLDVWCMIEGEAVDGHHTSRMCVLAVVLVYDRVHSTGCLCLVFAGQAVSSVELVSHVLASEQMAQAFEIPKSVGQVNAEEGERDGEAKCRFGVSDSAFDAHEQGDEEIQDQHWDIDPEENREDTSQDQSANQSDDEQGGHELPVGDRIAHFFVHQRFPQSILVIHPGHFLVIVPGVIGHFHLGDEIDFSPRPCDSPVEFLILISEHGPVEIAYFLKNAFFETSEGNRVSFNNTAASYSE